MQKFILSRKDTITLLSGLLIAAAYLVKFVWGQDSVAFTALAVASILGLLPIAIQAFQALKYKVVSIDVLVTMAVLGAFIIREVEESAIVTFLFLFGAYLEHRSLNKTRSAIKALVDMAPQSALKQMPDGNFEEVGVDEVEIGDVLLVKTGAKVPVDGTVLSGEAYVNEASITGESMPVFKTIGLSVYAGSILENGTLQISAQRVGEDTTFGKIIALVEEAQDSKSEAERFIDRFSKYYTPLVLVLAILVGLLTKDMELAITILVLGCPGALVIGVPVSNVAGIGNGATHGVLLKGSEVIHDFSHVDTLVFDKTGTLTLGVPHVVDVIEEGEPDPKTWEYLVSIEQESDHPLAKAIVAFNKDVQRWPVDTTDVVKGGGVIAHIDGHRIIVGNVSLMKQEAIQLSTKLKTEIAQLENNGDSLVMCAIDGQVKLLLGIRDQIRPGVKEILAKLKKMGVKKLILLSGDHQGTVDKVAHDLGLTQAYGNMLPQDKARIIEDLQHQGEIVAFVGDGVNDSPSLALADIGIAMGSGTDVAIETSDVVLMNSDIGRLPHALGLAKATARNMRQNIVIAVGVVLFLLASLFYSDWMNMSVGMLVHEASILVVILNGMRLIRYKMN